MLTCSASRQRKRGEDAKKIMAIETSLAQAGAHPRRAARSAEELQQDDEGASCKSSCRTGIGLIISRRSNWPSRATSMSASRISSRPPTTVFKTASLDDWKTYLRWHLIHDDCADTFERFRRREFRFLTKDLTRDASKSSRAGNASSSRRMAKWAKRSANFTSPIISRRKPRRARSRWSTIFKEALADRIKTLEWMDEPTKQEALKKLAAFTVKIGYPDKWRDYSAAQDRSRPLRPQRHARRTISKSIAS